jgi:hypothetical protein
VIAAGQSEITFHALLNDCPTSVAGHDEAVKIKVEASQGGTCPLCKGRSALPVLPAMASRKERWLVKSEARISHSLDLAGNGRFYETLAL